MLPLNFGFHICGQNEISRFKDEYLTHIISFTHPQNKTEPDLSSFNTCPIIHKINMHDVFDNRYHPLELIWPNESIIGNIIELGKSIKQEVDDYNIINVLFQCSAGISRSTATAYIILNIILGEFNERKCWNLVKSKRHIARPNPLMVSLADKLLNRNFKMMAPMPDCVDWHRVQVDKQSQ